MGSREKRRTKQQKELARWHGRVATFKSRHERTYYRELSFRSRELLFSTRPKLDLRAALQLRGCPAEHVAQWRYFLGGLNWWWPAQLDRLTSDRASSNGPDGLWLPVDPKRRNELNAQLLIRGARINELDRQKTPPRGPFKPVHRCCIDYVDGELAYVESSRTNYTLTIEVYPGVLLLNPRIGRYIFL